MRSKRFLLTAFVLGGLLYCFASSISAQENEALAAAKRAYLEGRFEDSVRDLQPLLKSLQSVTDLRDAHFFLGLNYLALGREDDARGQFSAAVKQDPDFAPPASLYSPDVISTYQQVHEGLVGRLRVVSEPPGARVTAAGKELGRAPLDRTVLAGEYMIRAELEGHTPVERAIRVVAADETRVSLSLRAVAEPEPREPPKESEPPPSPTPTSTAGGGGMSGKTIGIIAGVGGGAAVAALAAGGGGDSSSTGGGPSTPSTPPPASQASISATMAPNPMIAQESGDRDFPWVVNFEVTVRESAGLSGNIDFINTTLRNLVTGQDTPALNFGADTIVARAGTNHVNARGSLTVPLGILYRLTGGERRAILFAEIRFTDERGNILTTVAQANIQ